MCVFVYVDESLYCEIAKTSFNHQLHFTSCRHGHHAIVSSTLRDLFIGMGINKTKLDNVFWFVQCKASEERVRSSPRLTVCLSFVVMVTAL